MSEKYFDTMAIIICGQPVISGCYLLRLSVVEPLMVQFGRFQGGKPIPVAPGTYLYLGSAMGTKRASTLAQRLLRHATRQNRMPQAIRPVLLEQLRHSGLGTMQLKAPVRKTLFWHIDYLLEETAVDLTHIIILRTDTQMENILARQLSTDPQTAPLANGLGASDDRGQTHLISIPASMTWWQNQAASI